MLYGWLWQSRCVLEHDELLCEKRSREEGVTAERKQLFAEVPTKKTLTIWLEQRDGQRKLFKCNAKSASPSQANADTVDPVACEGFVNATRNMNLRLDLLLAWLSHSEPDSSARSPSIQADVDDVRDPAVRVCCRCENCPPWRGPQAASRLCRALDGTLQWRFPTICRDIDGAVTRLHRATRQAPAAIMLLATAVRERDAGFSHSTKRPTSAADDFDDHVAERGILVEVEHVEAHRTKKEKKDMSQFERFVTEGNEKADD